MSRPLAGQVVLVTGGARRVGRAIVQALAADGARMAVHHFESADDAETLGAELQRTGCAAPELFEADLRDPRQVLDLAAAVLRRLGRLDVLINSAAVLLRQPFGTVTAEMWDEVLDLNLRAYFLLAQAVAPPLRAARGKIVNISDVAAFEPWPSYLPHSVSKAGVEMLTRGLARVLAPEVTVNGIAPGPVLLGDDIPDEARRRLLETIPLQHFGTPADVVRAIRFFLESDYVTGTTLVVDGGQLARNRTEAVRSTDYVS
ncbi:MAG: SDR family oxidoreductase [Gemmatimonadetes bacterium]|nr:SDR family oxidoreductase [Gemmatimonadota bacterium]